MHRALYTEILEDAPADARERERQAIERSIELLNAARMGPASREANEALHYLDRLWSLLLDDLANAENRLPKELRASLISIGIWILREIEDLRSQRTQSFKGLIDVREIICKGLEPVRNADTSLKRREALCKWRGDPGRSPVLAGVPEQRDVPAGKPCDAGGEGGYAPQADLFCRANDAD